MVVMERQSKGDSEPAPAAREPEDSNGEVAVGASPGEVRAGETGGGKLGIKGIDTDIPGSVVESVEEAVLLGLEPAAGEVVASLAGTEADVEKFQPLLGTYENGPREGLVETGDGKPEFPATGAPGNEVAAVVLGARLEFATLLLDSWGKRVVSLPGGAP
jgi:hypothetical protein